MHFAPVRVRLLNGPFTPSPLFETSRLWHFCKLGNQIILRGLRDFLPISGWIERVCYITDLNLSSKGQRYRRLLTLVLCLMTAWLFAVKQNYNSVFNPFLPTSASGSSVYEASQITRFLHVIKMKCVLWLLWWEKTAFSLASLLQKARTPWGSTYVSV